MAHFRSIQCKQGSFKSKIGVLEEANPLNVVNHALNQGVNHFVQKNQAETLRELRAARAMSRDPQIFLNFPVSCTLNPRRAGHEEEKNLTLLEGELINRNSKTEILQQIEHLFDESRLSHNLRDDVILTADELICNVLFNAVHEDGVNKLQLSAAVSLADKPLREPALFRIGALKSWLAVSCRDPFGTLEPRRMLERLHVCCERGAGTAIRMEETGTAGIGGYLMFLACSSFFMAVQAGKATQICVLFPVHSRTRDRQAKPKNLHWIKF